MCPTFIISVSPTTSIEQLNLQTSNLVHILITKGTTQKMQKLGQVDVWTRSHDLFLNIGIPFISLAWIKL